MTLKLKDNHELIAEIQLLVKEEKRCTYEVLNYLKEIETRKLYLEKSYSSLFAFCTEFLGYSEPEAQIRIQAMRLTRSVPTVEDKIRTGEITLSVAASVQSVFRKEEKRRREDGLSPLSHEVRLSVVKQIEKTSVRESQKILAREFPESSSMLQEKVRALNENKSKIEFVASNELVQKLERLKGLTAHKNFDGSLEKLIELLADMALKKLDAAPHGAHEVKSLTVTKPTRYIPAHVKRLVKSRDQGVCQYRDPQTNRQCGSHHGIELDHQIPFSRGGETRAENLQLLCASHNKFKSNSTKAPEGGTIIR